MTDILYEPVTSHQKPSGDRMLQVVQAFKSKREIDSVIGAVDGCHIAVTCPDENAYDYVSRKLYPFTGSV